MEDFLAATAATWILLMYSKDHQPGSLDVVVYGKWFVCTISNVCLPHMLPAEHQIETLLNSWWFATHLKNGSNEPF